MPIKLTPLAMAVLDLLHERDMHPYEMRQLMLNRHTDQLIKITAGSLYHTVERLNRDELITAVQTNRAGRRPERTVYTLAEAGRDAFAARLREMLAVPADEYPSYPAALSFAHTLRVDDAIEQLTTRQARLEAMVAADQASHNRLVHSDVPRKYWIDFAYRLMMRRTELEWTTELIDGLRAGRIDWSQPTTPKLSIVSNGENPEENAG
jgi:DNA-binding PadR family transcriptional regulator